MVGRLFECWICCCRWWFGLWNYWKVRGGRHNHKKTSFGVCEPNQGRHKGGNKAHQLLDTDADSAWLKEYKYVLYVAERTNERQTTAMINPLPITDMYSSISFSPFVSSSVRLSIHSSHLSIPIIVKSWNNKRWNFI